MDQNKVSEYFGDMTFGLAKMREGLPKDSYNQLIKVLERKEKLEQKTADAVAQAIKEWAVKKGATHYCHWFQPMRGLTAEKHDAFIDIQHSFFSELRVTERFSGNQLLQGEPDASSFPSGGMRSTFEARGYTAWDPTSPIFIMTSGRSRTLCIPSVFFGYSGHALDNKTHLLRSNEVLSEAAIKFLKLLGDVDVRGVTATLGVEQEYFLVDHAHAKKRMDLKLTGRTLLGAPSARGQQMEDHYFGAIPTRVMAFMDDFARELYLLGIPARTRHNEVAPAQFEMAPIFEEAGIAADHNTLTMEVARQVANRHGLMCLLHEKPFAGINGSGKHCNWSMSNDKGENLLDPGKTPHQNLRFLAILAVVVKSVYDHSDMLRASIATAGNDLRLGGNEAPPAIMSVFLGSLLSDILETIGRGEVATASRDEIIHLGVSHIPQIIRDSADRNRTSPFAFTGNKFEFRAVGSSKNVAIPVAILNAAIASGLDEATQRLDKKLQSGEHRDSAIIELVKELFNESKNIIFSGNNYSAEWHDEAKKRNLPILKTTADALPTLINEKSNNFLLKTKVFSKEELASRYHVKVENYVKLVLIETRVICQLVRDFVIPSVEKQLIQSQKVLNGAHTSALKTSYTSHIEHLENTLADIMRSLNDLEQELMRMESLDEKMLLKECAYTLRPKSDTLRSYVDRVEQLVGDKFWQLPKYRDMLFSHVFS